MNSIDVICKLNNDDSFQLLSEALEVNLTNKDKCHYTFWNTGINYNKNLTSLPNFFSSEGLDLLYLSLFIYYADRRIQREMFPDAWTRNINLYMPVLCLDKWNEQKSLIEELLSFLSGDIWNVEFRERRLNDIENEFQKKLKRNNDEKLDFDKMCMLSGGLDSFVGAIDLLESSDNIGFVNHYGGGASGTKFIDSVSESLKSEYPTKSFNVFKFHAAIVNGKEDTTRTRSLLFFAHAIVIATSMKRNVELYIPENGFISLNVPLTNSRLGSSSTRTTHPYYLTLLQRLLVNLNMDIHLLNPYQFRTKGEMILECRNQTLLKNNISNTMSCSHPDQGRMKKGGTTAQHCGTCLPCIIRRSSLKRANIREMSIYRDENFSSGPTAMSNLATYNIGIEKYKKSDVNIYSRIQISGPLENNLERYKLLYEKGMAELIDFMESFQ